MRNLLKGLLLTAGILSLASCAVRVMYLDATTTKTVRLRETIKGAKVWVKDSTGVTMPAKTDLLEGGYYRSGLK